MITYRPAEDEDARTVRGLHERMLNELASFGHDVPPTTLNVALFWSQVFRPAILSGHHGVVIAEDAVQPIGFIAVLPENAGNFDPLPKRAIDWGCYVQPEYRRKGVGRQLRSVAFNTLRDLGVRCVISRVLAANEAGLASYKQLGAQITGYEMQLQLND